MGARALQRRLSFADGPLGSLADNIDVEYDDGAIIDGDDDDDPDEDWGDEDLFES